MTIADNTPNKLLRLRQGSRYVVAVQMHDGTISPRPFWNETQALAAVGAPARTWSLIPIEVYSEHHREDVPDDAALFIRSTRRGSLQGIVVWSRSGIHPTILNSLHDALAVMK
jgi:hypothetical protein